MKDNRGKLLAAVAVLAMVVCTLAVIAPVSDAAEAEPTVIDSLEDLKAAATSQDSAKYVLAANITVDKPVIFNKNAPSSARTITIDLSNYTINSSSTTDASVLDFYNVTATINGPGEIKSKVNAANTVVDAHSGANLTLDKGVKITAEGDGTAGVGVFSQGTLTVENAVVNSTNSAIMGNGTQNGTKITINGGTFTSVYAGGVYFPSTQILDINGGTFTGKTGIEIRAGTVTIDGATINATGALDNKKAETDGPLAYGMAVAVNDVDGYAADSDISVTIGKEKPVTLNGAAGSYDVYVGDANGSGEDKKTGVFNTKTIGIAHSYGHNVIISMPGYTHNFSEGATDNYRFAAVDVTATSFTVPAGYVLNGKIEFTTGDNATFTKVTAGASGMSFSKGSIGLSGDFTVDASGSVTITGEAKVTGNTNINGSIKMTDGSSLLVPEGMELVAQKIEVEGKTTTTPKVTVLGNMEMEADGENVSGVELTVGADGSYTATTASDVEIKYDPQTGEFQFGDTLRSDYTVTYNEYLSQNLTIPAGVTLTISSTGNLNMAGYNIILYGNIVIESNGTVSGIGKADADRIVLMRGGSLQNDGVIGNNMPVTVSADHTGVVTDAGYTGTGSVTMNYVSGVSFDLANTSNGINASYVLTVTGSFQAEGAGSVHTVAIKDARIVGETYVGQDVTVSLDGTMTYLMGSATLTIDGVVNTDGKLTMKNQSAIVVNGNLAGNVVAETGDYRAGERYTSGTTGFTPGATSTPTSNAYLSGYTLSVGTYEYTDDSGSKPVSMIAQRLYVYGTVTYGTDADAPVTFTGTMEFTGNEPVIAAEQTLSLPEGLDVTSDKNIDVKGTIQYVTSNASDVPVNKFDGTRYTVTVTAPTRTITGYIVPFETAVESIADADRQTLYVHGTLETSTAVTLAANQYIDVSKATVTIGEDSEITLEPRSGIRGTVADVVGILTVKNGASCSQPAKFVVKTTGTDADGVGFTRYSGLQAAIDNAQSGDVITVVNTAAVKDLTVPAGITVQAQADISFSGTLTVEETASLVMKDNATLTATADKSKIVVRGTLDASEGHVAFTQDTKDNSVTSSGTTVMPVADFTALEGKTNLVLNGVTYQNEENCDVLTSAEAAIAAASAQDVNKSVTVYGTVSAGDLGLTVDMTVAEGASASFGTVSVSDGKKIVVVGTLTSDVSVQTGVAGSESASTVTMNKASGITVGAGKINDNGITVYQMYMFGTVEGAVSVSGGEVVVGNGSDVSLTVNGEKNSLAVAEGATLWVNEGMDLLVGKNGKQPSVTVDGTLVANKGEVQVGYTGTSKVDGYMVVNGTFTVADETVGVVVAYGSELAVTGTLDISVTENKAASVTVDGLLTVGEKITTIGGTTSGTVTGAVETGANGIVKAYNGADVSGALIDVVNGESQAGVLPMYINGNLYMTLYSEEASIGNAFLADEDFSIVGYDMVSLIPLYDIEDLEYWYSDAEMSAQLGTSVSYVEIGGEYDALYFKVNASNVPVKVSVGTGISLYIDNIRYTSGQTATLSVGQHTVSASVNPGYTGTVTVQFNGQTVTGQFTITPEMASNAYEGTIAITATGDIQQESTVVVNPSDSGDKDGLGLTDILLIVLVVLIVIMAIIVAMRLMRS